MQEERDRDIHRIHSQSEGRDTDKKITFLGLTFFRELFSDQQNPFHFPKNVSIDQILGLLRALAFRFRSRPTFLLAAMTILQVIPPQSAFRSYFTALISTFGPIKQHGLLPRL